VTLYDLLANGEPDARAVPLLVQTLEDDEDAIRKLGIKPYALISHREHHTTYIASAPRGYVYARLNPLLPELDRVGDQVLKEHRQHIRVRINFRKRVLRDHRSALLDTRFQVHNRVIERIIRAHPQELLVPSYPGEIQESSNELPHALDPINREVDVHAGIRIELTFVLLFQQGHVVGNHPKRFLHVVRRHIGELLLLFPSAI
jgi:hypothetical protein